MNKLIVLLALSLGLVGCSQTTKTIQSMKPYTNADYIRDHHCVFVRHFDLPPNVIIDDGHEAISPEMSWDRYECPNGQVVTMDSKP